MRVMLIDPVTGEGFDWNSPFRGLSRTYALSAPASISFTLPATYNRNVDENGYPWVYEKGTIVVVEEDNNDLISGLVDQAPLLDGLKVDAGGLSMLAKDRPWKGPAQSHIEKDALELWREIWEHIISQVNVKNFRVTGDTRCGVKVGKPASADYQRVQSDISRLKPDVEKSERFVRKHTRARDDAAVRMYKAGGNRKVIGEVTSGTESPVGSAGSYDAAFILHSEGTPLVATATYFYRTSDFSWVRYDDAVTRAAASDWLFQSDQMRIWEERGKPNADIISGLESWLNDHAEDGQPEPFELNWWSIRDLASKLDELREIGGFDYVERTEWEGDELVFSLDVRKNIGSVKDDLRFELKINVLADPELARGEIFSEIHAHGAGEGQTTLTAERMLDHPRLVPSVLSVENKDWSTVQQVRQGADTALDEARKALEYVLHGLEVKDHKFAPLHRFGVGDVIPIQGRFSDGVVRSFRLRIHELTREGAEKKVALEVKPA